MVLTALFFSACGSKLGAPNPSLVGQWKAVDQHGGDTWVFRPDGTFAAQGGATRSLAGAGSMVAKLPREGHWGEKGGLLSLDYTTLAAREKPVFAWKLEGGRLLLAVPGQEQPSVVLDRVP